MGSWVAQQFVARDGVNTAVAASAPFLVAPRKPNVNITGPVDGYHVDWGQLVSFEADVDDVQDDFIANDQVVWRGNKNGTFGTGRWVQTDQLPVGENIIEVTATNSLGARSPNGCETLHSQLSEREHVSHSDFESVLLLARDPRKTASTM